MRPYPFVLSLAFGASFLFSNTAQAEYCGSVSLPLEGAQEVIIGEFATVATHPLFPDALIPSGDVGVCWRDETHGWTLERANCDTTTPSADLLFLQTHAGDDTVTTLLVDQTYDVGGLEWIAGAPSRQGTPHAMYCGSDEFALAPWNPDFAFGVEAVLGTGTDRFFGTPGDDIAYSNQLFTTEVRIPAPWGPLTTVQTAPGDNASDVLCGGYGADELYGDADDSLSAEEVLDGGYGDDFCDGDPLNWGSTPGGSIFDVARHVSSGDYGCNTIERATTPAIYPSTWSMVHECWALDNPVDYFGL
ncbi:MAG: hypothetical protein ACRBN8_15895 [Nannocystales bacterium]